MARFRRLAGKRFGFASVSVCPSSTRRKNRRRTRGRIYRHQGMMGWTCRVRSAQCRFAQVGARRSSQYHRIAARLWDRPHVGKALLRPARVRIQQKDDQWHCLSALTSSAMVSRGDDHQRFLILIEEQLAAAVVPSSDGHEEVDDEEC
jgi:hypothetical protein